MTNILNAYSKRNQVQVYWGIKKVFLTKFIKRVKLKIIKHFKTAHFNESKKTKYTQDAK